MPAPIVVVEDDPQSQRLYADLIGVVGYPVLVTDCAAEGLEMIINKEARFAVLDDNLPMFRGEQAYDAMGVKLCGEVKKARGDLTRVILMTAHKRSFIERRQVGLMVGADTFLDKLEAGTMREIIDRIRGSDPNYFPRPN